MSNFTPSKIHDIWEKAKIVEGFNQDEYRQDIAGAWIQRDQFGTKELFGWEIDHMLPKSKGGTDNFENLQPLQWENNKSKADSFPSFTTLISTEENTYLKKPQNWKFNENFLDSLKMIYPDNTNLIT